MAKRKLEEAQRGTRRSNEVTMLRRMIVIMSFALRWWTGKKRKPDLWGREAPRSLTQTNLDMPVGLLLLTSPRFIGGKHRYNIKRFTIRAGNITTVPESSSHPMISHLHILRP
ncbi:hypothetical protein BU15DRAFT_63106 [Melanogaster broomeanus]|nr:hypothetical protein BU15DRAFT_63106 [Melanogaster broomeanus]